MTLTVDDDFGGFVAARWPDLEAVALVGAEDPAHARELTTRALAEVGGRWEEVLAEGAPTRAARAALLSDLARPARPGRPGRRPPPPAAPPVPASPEPPGTPDDEDLVARRLVEALGREPPLVRAALAAEALWECDDAETAHLAGVAPGPLADRLDTARARLVTAHREALADEGLSPADWRLERDLADALDTLVAAQPDPPDPAALVAGRARRVRRRSLLVGGAAVLATGGAGWWVLREATPAGGGTRATPDTAAAPAAGGDVWASTGTWPPRGGLASDSSVRALVVASGGPGARLLYAADVGGTRVVLAGLLGFSEGDDRGTVLRAWTGPAGAAAGGLTPAPLATDRIEGAADVVAVAVPAAPGSGTGTTRTVLAGTGDAGSPDPQAGGIEAVLLVLTRPTVESATWSPVVHPTANGSVERAWTLVRLEGGVGIRALDRAPGTAARVDVGGYAGPVAGAPAPPTTTGGLTPEEAATAYVAAATGEAPAGLRTEVVVDSPVAGDVLDAFAISATGGDGRVRLIHTTTPDGAVVRTLHLADDGRSGRGSLLGSPLVLPATDVDEPYVRRLDTIPPRTTRYLVVAPGAARCHLLAVTPAAYPVSDITPLKGDAAVVPIINGQDTNIYRLVLWGPDGRRFYDAVPERGRPLLDLRPW